MPTHTTAPTDPRSIVTPDAFEVAGELLGMPLATPRRRLAAILVDLAIIGLITVLTQSFALILGVLAAAFFVRKSFQRTEVRGSVFGRAMRLSLGCLGLFIAVVTVLIWLAVSFGPDLADVAGGLEELDGIAVESPDGTGAEATLGDVAGFLGGGLGLLRAQGPQEAQEAMEVLVRRGRNVGNRDVEIEAMILDLVPPEAPWADQAPDLLARAVAAVDEEEAEGSGAARAEEGPGGATGPPGAEPAAPVASLPLPQALDEYATLLEGGSTEAATAERRESLRGRLVQELAGDTLAVLENEVNALGDIAQSRQEALRSLQSELEEAEEGGGLFSWLRSLVDELGFGFGWATLYMTVVLSWWKGQTVGKKLLGIRVVRLDGQPITWWTAFERAGGYAAGFATGLLGFAQVWWDANRQAIHDRIVGTVVVVDGAERVPGWEQVL